MVDFLTSSLDLPRDIWINFSKNFGTEIKNKRTISLREQTIRVFEDIRTSKVCRKAKKYKDDRRTKR